MANTVYKETRLENLVIGGGVALNSVANTIILQRTPFKRLFIQPAAGDDGGALGAALYVYHAVLGGKRTWSQDTSYFGRGYTDRDIMTYLKAHRIRFTNIDSESRLAAIIANELIANKVVGFFHGRAEWGPRALGARSILASPLDKKMKDIVNVRIKFREPYRPFAPVVMAEKVKNYFDVGEKDYRNLAHFMLGVFPVKKEMRHVIPAVTHVDGSARPQIITRKQNSLYYDIVKRFGDKTGVYVLLNTSFNLKGEPIVNSPEDALKTFKTSGMDVLILEHCIVRKQDISSL
jgi:carbamoyltransferase